MAPLLSHAYKSTGYLMINEIEVQNFKCFDRLKINNCRRINIIVGDNGSGKTALLEGIFLALGSTTDMAVRFRQQRGLDYQFRGALRTIANAILADFFYRMDTNNQASITLKGSGTETRSVRIRSDDNIPSGFVFEWTDSKGRRYPISPQWTGQTLAFPETGELLPDFFYVPSTQTIPSIEGAERFSVLSRANRQKEFVDVFMNEYPWLQGFAIEVTAGSAAVYATVAGLTEKLAVANISGGINRFSSILVTMASRPRSVMLVDEIENGLYYKHYKKYWEAILDFSRKNDCQLFLTTHSLEWLRGLTAAFGDKADDIVLWRVERDSQNAPVFRQFFAEQVIVGIESGGIR
jgi:ABC-type branched-subunit amino acid transport system ATPase component